MTNDIRILPAMALAMAALLAGTVGDAAPAADDAKLPLATAPTMVVDRNVGVAMRDGALLSTDIYRPVQPGRYPVLLVRTCYTKGGERYETQAAYWTSRGYVLVVQDVFGRGDSDGVFYPLVREAKDGSDMISWLAKQPWSNGKIGMYGNSYLGWTQVYAAGERNPALVAINPTVTPPDPDRNFPVTFGVPMPSGAAWASGLDGHINQYLPDADVVRAHATSPSRDFDKVLGRRSAAWGDWIDHVADPAYWARQRYQPGLTTSDLPMLHLSGWYDDVLVGTTENFSAMTSGKNAPSPRQRLVIGPWSHGTVGSRMVMGTDFGAEAQVDIDALRARWFDRWMKGEDEGYDRQKPVRLFVMGRNSWIDEDRWPIVRTVYTRYYLRSDGKANGRDGDGRLELETPGRETADRYRYDPANPVPFLGGYDWHQVGGPDDFAEIERRKDVLVYTSRALAKPLMICGPIRMRLFASSSARDTDWTAKLLDVRPDGKAIRLNDGIVRARFRDGIAHEKLLTPGKVEAYDIDLWSTCIELAPGHRLRVEIASSAHGKFDRNLNSGGRIGYETEAVVADQSVFHDASRASYILLPIVPAAAE